MKKQIKVAYFPSTALRDNVLTSNGKSLDEFCTKCEVNENLETGNYLLDATFTISALEYLEKENILKVLMDYGHEVFRISKVDVDTTYITIVARQITIAESLTLYLDDVRPTNQNGQGALSHLLTNTTGTKEITLTSDISNTNTAYYEDMSLYKVLHDSDNSFISRWGGEVQRRLYNLTINATIGADRGVTIREGKNLTGFTGTTNIDSLVTRARGKGFDGIKGNWIDSPLINSYARIHTQTIEYSDVKVKGDSDTEGYDTLALAQAELDRRVALEYSENDIDKMKAIYNINFAQLEKTEEYKNYIQAERVYLGDTIRVYVPKLNTDIKVRAIERTCDVLAQKTKDLKLSNVVVAQTLSNNQILADIKKQLATTNSKGMASYIDSIIKGGMQGSYFIARDNEALWMDTKDINTAMEVFRINKDGLAFSSTGYYGEYDFGFTRDGVINASLVRAGILSAILIQSLDGGCSINLDTGVVSFNKGLIQGLNSEWNLDTGKFTSSGVDAANNPQSLTIDDGGITSSDYLVMTAPTGIQSYVTSPTGRVTGFFFGDGAFSIQGDRTNIITDNTNGELSLIGALTRVSGNFSVTGDKQCLQTTKNYGLVPFYANEDINSLLTKTPTEEIFETIFYEDTGKYKAILKIDFLTKECINTDIYYNVWLSKLGQGDLWIANTYPSYFVVESDRPIKFKYKLEGRRRNFEDRTIQTYLKKFYKEA